MNELIDHLLANRTASAVEPNAGQPRVAFSTNNLQLVTGVHGSGIEALLDAHTAQLETSGVTPAAIARFDFSDARLAPWRDRTLPARVLDRFFAANPQARRTTCHVLLNRIDLVEGWEATLASLMDVYDLRVVATGEQASWCDASFAQLRHAPSVQELSPLNLVEFGATSAADPYSSLDLGIYLERGGLPAAATSSSEPHRTNFLQALVRDAVLLKEAVDPALHDVPLALRLAGLALGSAGGRFSITRATQTLREQDVRTTRATLTAQLAALCDLHLLYAVTGYDAAGKANPRAAATYYAGDHALAAAFAAHGTPNSLAIARNAVYLHLRRTNPFGGIYTYKVGTASVDFAVGNPATGAPRALFHVASRLEDAGAAALKQQFALLDRAMEETGLSTCALIHLGQRHTAHRTPHGTVRCIPLATWLLGA